MYMYQWSTDIHYYHLVLNCSQVHRPTRIYWLWVQGQPVLLSPVVCSQTFLCTPLNSLLPSLLNLYKEEIERRTCRIIFGAFKKISQLTGKAKTMYSLTTLNSVTLLLSLFIHLLTKQY